MEIETCSYRFGGYRCVKTPWKKVADCATCAARKAQIKEQIKSVFEELK